MITKRNIWIGLIAIGLYLISTLLTCVTLASANTYYHFIGFTIMRNGRSNTLALENINAFLLVHILLCIGIAWSLVTFINYAGNRKRKI